MAADEKWYFTKEQLANTPSRKCGYDADKELSCRQQAANFIQDMGQRLQVTQLCINTAIVYMHRFYMFHSFSRFHRNAIASAALFLAAKVEEQPRKLEHVIKVAQICLHREQPPMDIKSEAYAEHSHDLVMNENILLQTLGFDVAIDHPHTHVVKCCHLVKASKDLAQTSYFMASNSLHLTTMCLQYKPTVVACFCIHLACKWSNWEIPQSNEGRPWFWYVDRSVTQELLEQLTDEFLAIFEKCPSRLKKKIISISSNQNQNQSQNPMLNIPPEMERRSKGVEGTTCFGPISSIVPPQAIASSSSSEDIKKKMELSQRPPPDYKKPHSSHHPRLEGHNTNVVKTSCVFAPPQRTHPQHNLHAMGGTGRMPSAAPHQPQPHQAMVQPHRTRLPPHQLPRNGSYHNTEQNHGSFNKKYERPPSSIGHSNSGAEKVQCPPTSNNSSSVPVLPPPPSEPIPSNFVPPLGSVTLSTRPSFPLPPMPTQPLPPMLNTDPVSVPPSFPSVVSHKPLLDIPIISPVPTFPETTPVFLQAVKLPTVSQSPKPKTPPPRVKPERSIFSPEKTTPPPIDTSNSDLKPELTSPSAVNPPLTPGKSARNRNSSSSSEAELVPVTPKIEEVSGFELLGKGETSIKLPGRIPDLIQPIKDQARETVIPKEEKPPDLIKSFPEQNYIPEDHNSKEHKKKKKKHKEGKHKEKHKDKHKHKHKNRDPEPIVITIPKEKITFSQPPPDQSLKIKIAKDKIAPSPALKIKIPKDKIKESRKRERSEERTPGLPTKHHRPNGTTLQVNKVVDLELENSECCKNEVGLLVSQKCDTNLGKDLLFSETSNILSDTEKNELSLDYNSNLNDGVKPQVNSSTSSNNCPKGQDSKYKNVSNNSPHELEISCVKPLSPISNVDNSSKLPAEIKFDSSFRPSSDVYRGGHPPHNHRIFTNTNRMSRGQNMRHRKHFSAPQFGHPPQRNTPPPNSDVWFQRNMYSERTGVMGLRPPLREPYGGSRGRGRGGNRFVGQHYHPQGPPPLLFYPPEPHIHFIVPPYPPPDVPPPPPLPDEPPPPQPPPPPE